VSAGGGSVDKVQAYHIQRDFTQHVLQCAKCSFLLPVHHLILALPSRLSTPCALVFSNASKKYQYVVVEYFSSAYRISDWRSRVT